MMRAMATKTISIDLDAYDRLCAVRREHESFSATIKRVVRPPLAPEDVERLFRENELSRAAGAAIRRRIAQRRRDGTRSRRRGLS